MIGSISSIWGHKQRPWGYEIRVDLVSASGRDYQESITFEKKPSAKDEQDAAGALLVKVNAREKVFLRETQE